MRDFFQARHVAVFGVSTRNGNLGARIVNSMLRFGYDGRISLIGRSGGEIRGLPIRPSLDEVPEPVDLAVIMTPAATIPDLFLDCARHGIRHLVVESGGFAELDEYGIQLSARLKRVARENGQRFIGPNCIGVVDIRSGLATPFSSMPKPPLGTISVLTQSGGVGMLYANHLDEEGVGLSKFVSLGNKLDVDENDLVPFFAQDPETQVILAYLESIADGRRLFELIRACPKPVVVHKSNIGRASAAIAGSHTAALMNDDAVVDAALRQAGALRTATLNDTVAAVKAFLLPPMRGDRVVVVSRSGGHAIIAADECGKVGFKFPPLPPATIEKVRHLVRADVIRLGNPLDLGDLYDADSFLMIMDEIMGLPMADGVIFLFLLSAYAPEVGERIVRQARELTARYDKPLALVVHTWPEELARLKRVNSFPIFETAEDAVAALAHGRDHWRFSQRAPKRMPRVAANKPAAELLSAAAPGTFLRQDEAFALLDHYGLPHPPAVPVSTARQAAEAAAKWGGPVVLKLESPEATHKTDVGGVILGLSTGKEIKAAFGELERNLRRHLPQARFTGALVMPMAPRGLELIAGVKKDANFGPVLLLGWGGTAAEAMEKVSLRLAPLSPLEARQMIDELPGQKLLQGFRGRPPIDRRALVDLLVRLSRLACAPGVAEIDLNPVRLYPDGVRILDARVKVE